MFDEYKKTIIISVIDIIIILLIVLFALVDINLGPIGISSINGIKSQFEKVKVAEAELTTSQKLYDATLEKLNDEKDKFESAKKKYESISDETIKLIKEATAKENYSIEYMWIRLGNYAKLNNLSIVLVEPGNTEGINQETSNETVSTPVSSDGEKVESANKDENDEDMEEQDSSDKILTIQVSGTYMNISDFIFQVENDSELKFKLDNLAFVPMGGTEVNATFNVKNMIVLK